MEVYDEDGLTLWYLTTQRNDLFCKLGYDEPECCSLIYRPSLGRGGGYYGVRSETAGVSARGNRTISERTAYCPWQGKLTRIRFAEKSG